MKFKLNWGQSLFLALGIFVIFIGSFVYKTLVIPEYNHSLVSEEYYKEEINFQQEIDRLNNATELTQNLFVKKSSKGLALVFPDTFDYSKITAHLKLQRISDDNFDITKQLVLDSLTYLIPDKHLIKGRYTIKVNWEYDNIPYQLKDKIDY